MSMWQDMISAIDISTQFTEVTQSFVYFMTIICAIFVRDEEVKSIKNKDDCLQI